MAAASRFPTSAMLLAAGLGKRLRPLTEAMPKPLVPVAGTPLIDRVIANAMAEGVTDFVVNLHYRAAEMRAHVEALTAGHFSFSDETDALLETGGGVKRALPLLTGDPVLVMNTDAFWPADSDAPLARLAKKFAESGADMVLLCVLPFHAKGFRRSHDFCLDPRGLITNDAGAPVIYAGVALIARRVIEALPDGPVSLVQAIDAALTRETLYGVLLDAPWLHVGDPEGLAQAEAALAG